MFKVVGSDINCEFNLEGNNCRAHAFTGTDTLKTNKSCPLYKCVTSGKGCIGTRFGSAISFTGCSVTDGEWAGDATSINVELDYAMKRKQQLMKNVVDGKLDIK